MRRRLLAITLLSSAVAVAGCGSGETVTPTPETVQGTIAQATVAEGDPAAGKEVYAAQGCGSCHTFEEAGSTGQVGPNLDESLQGDDADFIRESIVDPDAEIAEGYQPGVMPSFEGQLSDTEIEALVEYLQQATQGG